MRPLEFRKSLIFSLLYRDVDADLDEALSFPLLAFKFGLIFMDSQRPCVLLCAGKLGYCK